MTSRRWLITLVACLAIFAVLGGFKFLQIRAAIEFGKSFPEASESVEAVVVDSLLSSSYVTTIGEIVSPQSVELRNELEGRITAVNFASGGRVDKGDILLQLDISEESARLKAAAARANLARLDLERFTRLFASKTVSEEQVDQARAEFDMASASVNELQAIIAKKSLKAPFAAVAGLHQLEAGEFLQANTPIVMLVGINDHAWVDFNLAITQGTVDIGSEVGVVAPGGRGDGVPAVVIARNPAVSASSRNMRYRAKISANPLLPPNSVVNIRIPIGSEQQVQVPATAVLRDELGAYVFVLDAEANGAYRARRQSVTVGREEDQMVGVSGGLQVGSLVATDGAFKLRDNLLTHVRQRPGDRAGQRGE